MTTLTIEFRGVTEKILNELVAQGYAKTKSEAVRYAILHVGEEIRVKEVRLHERAEDYAYEEIKEKLDKAFRRK